MSIRVMKFLESLYWLKQASSVLSQLNTANELDKLTAERDATRMEAADFSAVVNELQDALKEMDDSISGKRQAMRKDVKKEE